MNYEAIVAATFAQLKTVAPFRTASRRGAMPGEIGEQPALYFIPGAFNYPPRIASGAPAKVTIDAGVFIYDTPQNETDDDFGSTINGYLGKLHDTFAPDAFGRPQTLNGLAYDVRIEGEVLIDYGHTTGQALLHIPLKILVP